MKVVFDSNIYVSALVFPGGVAEEALRAANERRFSLALSREIIAEVLEVLSRKFSRDSENLARAALAIAATTELVTTSSHVDVLADAPDNRILECALAAHADVVVTGDRQMLALGTWQGIEMLSLREFMDRLQGKTAGERRAVYRSGRRSRAKSRAAA